jgi:hypothetical protein
MRALRSVILVFCLVLLAVNPGAWGSWALAVPLPQEAPTRLAYGDVVDGVLDQDQPSAFFVFDGRAGDVVTITMTVTGGSIDPFLVLNSSDRTPLAMDDNSGGESNARLSYAVETDASYVIQATHAGGIMSPEGGTFSLALAGEGMPGEGSEALGSGVAGSLAGGPFLAPLGAAGLLTNELTRQNPLRLYWFEAAEGDQLVVMPQQMAEFQPLLALYDAGFNELGRAQPGANLRVALGAGNVHFLAVSLPGVGGAGGVFELAVDRGGELAAAGEPEVLEYGDVRRGVFDEAVPAVSYRFVGVAGDRVEVRVSRAEGDLRSRVSLVGEGGEVLVEGSDVGDGVRLEAVLPADGAYLVMVTGEEGAAVGSVGSFVLELRGGVGFGLGVVGDEVVLSNDYANLPRIQYGDTVEGEISDGHFMDIYVFLGEGGDTITAELRSLNAGTSLTALDPLLILLDDGRIPLAEHDDIVEGVERDARLEFTLPRTAYYAIVATRFDQAEGTTAGPYSLSLSGPGSPPTPATATATGPSLLPTVPLVSGEPVQGILEKGASLYSFTAFAGSLADISVTTDPGLDVLLILADENLNELHASNTGALTGIALPASGRYLLMVVPRFGPADDLGRGYIVALTLAGTEEPGVTPANGVRQLAYGDLVNGAISDSTTSQVFTFDGLAGERVQITMKASPGSTLDSYLELQDANGAVIDANDDIVPGQVRDAQIVTELPADGSYVVIASRYVGPDAAPTQGAYELFLERVEQTVTLAESPAMISLSYGQSETGEITADQYLLFYVFSGQAGDTVTVRIAHRSGNLDSVLHLYQSTGDEWVEIASNDDSPAGGTYEALLSNIILPQTAKYLIAVSRYGLDRETTAGTFTITLVREQ